LRKISRTNRLARLRSTARGATRLLAMMPRRARDRPLGLTNKVKWRRRPAAPVARASVYCSRRSSRALRGSVAGAPALRRSAVRVLWHGARAALPARRESACARESHGCACGASSMADMSVSSWSVRLLKSALLQPLTLGRVNLFLSAENVPPAPGFCG
jgi:hypothetical protein